MKTKITVKRAVLHAIARRSCGLPDERLVDGGEIERFCHRLAGATALRGDAVELEITE